MRITLVIAHLGLGGAERVLCSLADHMAGGGHEVTLLTLDESHAQFYQPKPVVRRLSLDFGSIALRAHRRLPKTGKIACLMALRRAIIDSRPDVVVSFMNTTNIYTLLSTLGTGIPVIASERNDPRHDLVSPGWQRLRNLLYPHAAALVFQTENVRRLFKPRIQSRSRVIPNGIRLPVGFVQSGRKTPGPREAFRLIAMGRLSKQKGFDLLLESFSRLASKHPRWSLTFWGEGEERNSLERQAREVGLADRVNFPGQTKDSFKELIAADLFVLSSRYEGFPNVLCEAMACGIPVVSFDCPSGPGEIIRDGLDGVLVPAEDVSALTAALDRLMTDPDLRERLAAQAPAVCQRFSHDRIMHDWEELIVKTGNLRS